MKIQFAKMCAWRAIYFKTAAGYQFFHIGVDPNDGVKPALFGRITIRSWNWKPGDKFFRFGWRIPLPTILWASWYRRPSWFWQNAYHVSKKFWHRVDGRYGSRRSQS